MQLCSSNRRKWWKYGESTLPDDILLSNLWLLDPYFTNNHFIRASCTTLMCNEMKSCLSYRLEGIASTRFRLYARLSVSHRDFQKRDVSKQSIFWDFVQQFGFMNWWWSVPRREECQPFGSQDAVLFTDFLRKAYVLRQILKIRNHKLRFICS